MTPAGLLIKNDTAHALIYKDINNCLFLYISRNYRTLVDKIFVDFPFRNFIYYCLFISVSVVVWLWRMERRSNVRVRVAVIGAGPAGLCAARHILSRPETFDPPVVYETTDHLGGTWFYEERVGPHDNGYPIHSSMYRDLR